MMIATGQDHLPLYEVAGPRSFHLAVGPTVDPSIASDHDTITVMDGDGAHIATLDSLWWTHIPECCHDSSRWFAIGRYVLREPIDLEQRAYINGVVQGARIEWIEVRNVLPLIAREWVWLPDIAHHDSIILVQRQHSTYGGSYDRAYPILLKNCTAVGTDSLTELHCPAHGNGYIGDPDLLFLYVNDTLISAQHDVRKTGLDGYGPFHYRAQGLLARYRAADGTYLVLQSGAAFRRDAQGWAPVSRAPVMYYGECDCPED